MTKSPRTLLLVAMVFIGGCGESLRGPSVEQSTAESAQPVVIPGSLSYEGPLGLLKINPKSNPDDDLQSITVGATPAEFNVVYKPNSNEAQKLVPPQLGASYTAVASENSSEGNGAIYFHGPQTAQSQDRASLLALAMHRYYSIPDFDVERIQGFYTTKFRRYSDGQHSIIGDKIRYWFWNDKNVRLMLVAVAKGGSDRYDLTEAVGDFNVMNALRMSPDRAAEDRAFIEPAGSKKSGTTIEHAG